MAAKIAGRPAQSAWTKLDLPTMRRPQVVDSQGYELDDAEVEALYAAHPGFSASQEVPPMLKVKATPGPGADEAGAEDPLPFGPGADADAEGEKEQLLSLAER